MDVGIIADLSTEHLEPIVNRLGEEFYADAQMMRQAIARRSDFNLIHLETMFKVDIFVARDRPFDQQQLARRQPQLLESPDQVAYVASPENVILAKLEWYRMGGEVSERQWWDVQGILDVQGARLDRTYLQQWAATLQVADLLARAWAEYEEKQSRETNDRTAEEE